MAGTRHNHLAILGAILAASPQAHDLGVVALRLAGARFRVLPCVPGGKRPLTGHGLTDASEDTARVRSWWRRWPDANIGLRTGSELGLPSIDVLDIDVHGQADGFVSLTRLRGAGLVPGPALRVVTASGGQHWYFPARPAQRSWNEARSGIDLRAGGGYVIIPPSVVPQPGSESGRYRLIDHQLASAEMIDGAAIRAELRPDAQVRLRIPASRQVETGRLVAWMAAGRQGERNTMLFWAACRLAENGATPATVAQLRQAAIATGLSGPEVEATIRSAYFTTTRPVTRQANLADPTAGDTLTPPGRVVSR